MQSRAWLERRARNREDLVLSVMWAFLFSVVGFTIGMHLAGSRSAYSWRPEVSICTLLFAVLGAAFGGPLLGWWHRRRSLPNRVAPTRNAFRATINRTDEYRSDHRLPQPRRVTRLARPLSSSAQVVPVVAATVTSALVVQMVIALFGGSMFTGNLGLDMVIVLVGGTLAGILIGMLTRSRVRRHTPVKPARDGFVDPLEPPVDRIPEPETVDATERADTSER